MRRPALLLAFMATLAAPLAAQTATDTLRSYVACYAREMQLERWNLHLVLGRDLRDEGEAYYAATEADPSYLDAVLSFDTVAFAAMDDTERRQTVVHELLHVWLWDLAEPAWARNRADGERREERTVTQGERWSLWLKLCRGRP